jgi:lipid II:glycine glycyltransferase (peptidoglycan interpeptide bridge formation enzyme)
MKMPILFLSALILLAPAFSQAGSADRAMDEFKLGSSIAGDKKTQERFDVEGLQSVQNEKLRLNSEFAAKRAGIKAEIASFQAKIKESPVPVKRFQAYIDDAKNYLGREFVMYEGRYDSASAKEQAYHDDLLKLNPNPKHSRKLASVDPDQLEVTKIFAR